MPKLKKPVEVFSPRLVGCQYRDAADAPTIWNVRKLAKQRGYRLRKMHRGSEFWCLMRGTTMLCKDSTLDTVRAWLAARKTISHKRRERHFGHEVKAHPWALPPVHPFFRVKW